MSQRSPAEIERLEKQIRRIVELAANFPKELKETRGRHWFFLTLLDIAKAALRELRDYIEDPDEPGISWESPRMESRCLTNWDWSRDIPNFGGLRVEDADLDDAKLVERAREIGWIEFYSRTLHLLNKEAYYRRREGKLEPYLPFERLDALASFTEAEQQSTMAALYRPLTLFGDLSKPAHANWMADSPDKDRVNLSRWMPAEMRLSATDPNGSGAVLASGLLVIRFRHLVVDDDAKAAYFPIEVGIDFDPVPSPSIRGPFFDCFINQLDAEMAARLEQAEVPNEFPLEAQFPPELLKALREGRVLEVPSVQRHGVALSEHLRAYTKFSAGYAELGGDPRELPLPKIGYQFTDREPAERFPSPAGLTWEQVRLHLPTRDRIRVQVGEIEKTYGLAQLGLQNLTSGEPNRLWAVLKLLADWEGKIPSPEHLPGRPRPRPHKPKVSELRRLLQAFFCLEDDPFLPFQTAGRYQARFTVSSALPRTE